MDIKFVSEIFLTVLSLLLLIVPGYVLAKTKMIGDIAESVLSTIVLFVCSPLVFVTSFQKTAFSTEILWNMLIVAALCLVIHGIMIAFVFLVVRGNDKKKNCLRFTAVFSNCGYMGIPFLQILYGGSGEVLVYVGVVIGVFNILAWTAGVVMVTGDKSNVSLKKALLNPNIIGLLIGVALFVVFQRPIVDLAEEGSFLDGALEKLFKSLSFFGDMVTPLSMSVIGIKLSKISFKKLFTDGNAYLSSALKLVVMSLFAGLAVAFLPVSGYVKNVLFFTLSMPSATMAVLFSVNYDGDAESATVNVLLSTALSVITVPLLYMLYSLVCV